MSIRIACVGIAAVALAAAGCKQTETGTDVKRAEVAQRQDNASVGKSTISPSTVTDNDEMVDGVIPANPRKVREALLAVIKEEEIRTGDTKSLGNVDGSLVLQPNVGAEIRVEYQLAGEEATRLRLSRNPRTHGVKADPVLRTLFERTRARAVGGR